MGQSPDELTDLSECFACLLLARADEFLGPLGVAIDALAGKPEVDRQHHQSLLRAVVQIALDPAQLARLDIDDGGSALAERLDLAPQRATFGRAQETGHHLALQSDDDLRQGCRDEQQQEASDRCEPERW
jgi:hypothetical protein